ncbi:hypothetical protein ACFL27_02550 [candidate division CSSED10-310 bacterium]|uniref:DUF3365 domain-containing protein n=1 Tax=candidate division CSSED10-310 bacterium TaxID=2855610 RepID=A0ABV6YSD8_UNCC1
MNLAALPLPIKLSVTFFIVLTACGLVVSEILVHSDLHPERGCPLPNLTMIKAKYSYSPLYRAVLTTMRKHLENKLELKAIIDWCQSGGDRTEFYEKIAPILNQRCLHCHGKNICRGDVSLRNWGDLAPLVINRGLPVAKLIRQTHYHIFGFGILILGLTLIFNLTRYSNRAKIWLTVIAYTAALVNILGWWAAKLSHTVAVVILISGLTLMLTITIIVVLSFLDLWVLKQVTSAE